MVELDSSSIRSDSEEKVRPLKETLPVESRTFHSPEKDEWLEQNYPTMGSHQHTMYTMAASKHSSRYAVSRNRIKSPPKGTHSTYVSSSLQSEDIEKGVEKFIEEKAEKSPDFGRSESPHFP